MKIEIQANPTHIKRSLQDAAAIMKPGDFVFVKFRGGAELIGSHLCRKGFSYSREKTVAGYLVRCVKKKAAVVVQDEKEGE